MLTQDTLKKTPLFEEHLKLKARVVPFGGWEMPVQYEGIIAEYEQTRKSVTIFDTCHMGEFIVEGKNSLAAIDKIVSMKIKDMPLKTCRYGFILNKDGGVIDDLIIFRIEEDKWFIVVNGATIQKDATHFLSQLSDKTLFKDISSQTGKIDVQGPLSRDVLKGLIKGIEKLDYYTFDYFECLGEKVLVSRTGYTGELGYEIYFPWNKTAELWRKLLTYPEVKPAGLGARDVLRLEVGYSLYGHELSDQINPLEAGLGKFVDFEKDFFGKNALVPHKQKGVARKIVGFTSDSRRSPRADQKIYSNNQEEIGFVTSGTFSPYLQKGIGLGFVKTEFAQKGNSLLIGEQKNQFSVLISERSFYNKGSLKV